MDCVLLQGWEHNSSGLKVTRILRHDNTLSRNLPIRGLHYSK